MLPSAVLVSDIEWKVAILFIETNIFEYRYQAQVPGQDQRLSTLRSFYYRLERIKVMSNNVALLEPTPGRAKVLNEYFRTKHIYSGQ